MSGRDVDELEPVLALEQIDRLLISGIFHWPAADPVTDVGEIVHSTLESVGEDLFHDLRQALDVLPHPEAPDVPQDHHALCRRPYAIVFLLDLVPELLLDTCICRVEREIK